MAEAAFSADIGRSQFLDLFVTQLQYQDPLEPSKQGDFLAQLAQFSQVEGLEKINSKFDSLLQLGLLSEGSGLLGREVTTSGGLTGIAKEVSNDKGQVLVNIGGTLVPLADISTIRSTDSDTEGSIPIASFGSS